MRTFHIKTLGCKVNQYEGQAIRERLAGIGLKEAGADNQADLCILNICTVTQAADAKSRAAIRQMLRKNRKAKIVVTGCFSKADAQKLGTAIKGINYIIPKSFFADGISNFSRHTRVFVKVQDGCNYRCSFCKVPLVRGRSRSRAISQTLDEVKRIVAKGCKEIVLTGVCLGSFGLDLKSNENLVRLIEALEMIPQLMRIRLSSIEPKLVNRQLINLFGSSSKLCRHLHIPLQSADNRILEAMDRHYKREDYLRIIEEIRGKAPDVGITTDVIVGFPGEDRSSFENTLKFLRRIQPLRVHRFLYSPRIGTTAIKKISLLPKREEAQKWMDELKNTADDLSLHFRNLFKNKELDVLVEEIKDGYLAGYSSNYIRIGFPGSKKDLNHIRIVKVDRVTNEQTWGSSVSRREIAQQG